MRISLSNLRDDFIVLSPSWILRIVSSTVFHSFSIWCWYFKHLLWNDTKDLSVFYASSFLDLPYALYRTCCLGNSVNKCQIQGIEHVISLLYCWCNSIANHDQHSRRKDSTSLKFFIFISQEHDHEVCLNFDITLPYDNDNVDVVLW